MSTRNLVTTGVVIVIVIVVGWWFISSQRSQAPQTEIPITIEQETSTQQSSPSGEVSENEVLITSSGFSPKDLTIKKEDSVTWVNSDTATHQVNSAIHPTHQLYPPLNTIGLLQQGEKKSLSFPDPGTYKYHDHLNPSFFGSITVE